eukprot:636716_1
MNNTKSQTKSKRKKKKTKTKTQIVRRSARLRSQTLDDKSNWCTKGGDRHDWKRWHKYTTVKKYYCTRPGCGFFKKCWEKCNTSGTICNGCHVIGHKRFSDDSHLTKINDNDIDSH